MRIRRHFQPFQDFKITPKFWKWLGIGVAMVLAGYLTAYLILFPAPFLPGHQPVPRVLGLTLAEAQAEIQKSKLQVTDGGAEPHPSAPAGSSSGRIRPRALSRRKERKSLWCRAPARPRFRCRMSPSSMWDSRNHSCPRRDWW